MEIDYGFIDTQINDYAINIVYEILEKYQHFLNDEIINTLTNRIVENRIIKVNEPSKIDESFFKGNIPTAHGPRAKNDGYIHVYPYKYKQMTTEEILNKYIDHIIIHELYHFLIKLDIKEAVNQDEIDFGHYITEGMVQLFAEMHTKKDFSSNYRKNVDNARIIYEACQNNLSLIFQNNYKEIFLQYPELNIVFENYKKEKEFNAKLESFFNKIAPKINIQPKRLIEKAKSYSIDEVIIKLKDFLEKVLNPEELKDANMTLDDIYNSIYEQKRKEL